MAIGPRDDATARGLWTSLPAVYRQYAICYTAFWAAYAAIIPSARHRLVDKAIGQTNHVKRVNTTLPQGIVRLVRKTRSVSQKVTNHVGAIWYFIHRYNASRASV